MNCSQVQKLLPLYADHDFGGRRHAMIRTHLESCAACSGAAAEYGDARELMRHFAPPAFGDEVYAGIRQSVWQQIESESELPSRFEALAAWFQPRFAWSAAAAVLIIVSAVGVYFVAKRFTARSEIIVNAPKKVQPENSPGEKLGAGFSNPHEGTSGPRQADVPRRRRKPVRMVAPDRGNSLVAYSPGAQVNRIESSSPIIGKNDSGFAARDAERTLRMEIQTKDPNIRIIWFAQGQ